tara:strand:- start:2642 stop:3451 length:810 start_codon:yes stop_codon:yes gene_type:complete
MDNLQKLFSNRRDLIKQEIEKKRANPLYKPTRETVQKITTDYDHKSYTKYYRQSHLKNDAVIFNNQSGYMILNNKDYKMKLNREAPSTCCNICNVNVPPYTHPSEYRSDIESDDESQHEDNSGNVGGCSGTEFGCCPDGVTARLDSSGSNCTSLISNNTKKVIKEKYTVCNSCDECSDSDSESESESQLHIHDNSNLLHTHTKGSYHTHDSKTCKSKPCKSSNYSWYPGLINTGLQPVGNSLVLYGNKQESSTFYMNNNQQSIFESSGN